MGLLDFLKPEVFFPYAYPSLSSENKSEEADQPKKVITAKYTAKGYDTKGNLTSHKEYK